MTNKKNEDVKKLDDQMLEYSKHQEKVEKLKKELLVNPAWDIYYDYDWSSRSW